MQPEFTSQRLRSLVRLGAYTLLLLFVIHGVSGWLPFPSDQPSVVLARIGELLERSTLPLVAVLLLYGGLLGRSLPSLWEWRLARMLKPLLLLVAALYVAAGGLLLPVSHRIETEGVKRLQSELSQARSQLKAYGAAVERSSSAPELQRLLANQPALVRQLRNSGNDPAQANNLAAVRQQTLVLVRSQAAQLEREAIRRESQARGELGQQVLRRLLSAAGLALFFLIAGLSWPSRLPEMGRRIALARERRRLEEEEADDPGTLP